MLIKRIVPYNEASNIRYSTYDEQYESFVPQELKDSKEKFYFVCNSNPIGYFCQDIKEEVVNVSVWFQEELSFEMLYAFISMLTMFLIKNTQCKKIRLSIDKKYVKVIQANGYYAIGKQYQKVVEPWLLSLPSRTFDDEGYIINQGLMKEIPFGWFDTMRKGCGWIAAYNLLKMCGIDKTMLSVEKELSERVLLGAVAGQELHLLFLYLKKYIDCSLTLPYNHLAIQAMKKSKYGILLYIHNRGAHYVAYRHIKEDTFQFYNAIYGRKNHYETIEYFLKKNAFLPFSSVIYVK